MTLQEMYHNYNQCVADNDNTVWWMLFSWAMGVALGVIITYGFFTKPKKKVKK